MLGLNTKNCNNNNNNNFVLKIIPKHHSDLFACEQKNTKVHKLKRGSVSFTSAEPRTGSMASSGRDLMSATWQKSVCQGKKLKSKDSDSVVLGQNRDTDWWQQSSRRVTPFGVDPLQSHLRAWAAAAPSINLIISFTLGVVSPCLPRYVGNAGFWKTKQKPTTPDSFLCSVTSLSLVIWVMEPPQWTERKP